MVGEDISNAERENALCQIGELLGGNFPPEHLSDWVKLGFGRTLRGPRAAFFSSPKKGAPGKGTILSDKPLQKHQGEPDHHRVGPAGGERKGAFLSRLLLFHGEKLYVFMIAQTEGKRASKILHLRRIAISTISDAKREKGRNGLSFSKKKIQEEGGREDRFPYWGGPAGRRENQKKTATVEP